MKKQVAVLVATAFVVLAIMIAAVSLLVFFRLEPKAMMGTSKEYDLTIQQGTVGTYKDLRIGVANVGWETVLNSEGKKSKEEYAQLQVSFYSPDKEPKEQSFKVHVGERVEVGVYSVSVERIEPYSWTALVLAALTGSVGQGNGRVMLNVDSLWACDKINFPSLCP